MEKISRRSALAAIPAFVLAPAGEAPAGNTAATGLGDTVDVLITIQLNRVRIGTASDAKKLANGRIAPLVAEEIAKLKFESEPGGGAEIRSSASTARDKDGKTTTVRVTATRKWCIA